ncbi:MAG: Porphobilinogen deaminase [Phycisphaerae bacterium]|nr:Porphobilinogen deaminase [Phycisphaerae bacterium]
MTRTLILAAHGGGDGSDANALLRKTAKQIAERIGFDVGLAAFRLGEPSWRDALRGATGDFAVIVPVMTSEGYFHGLLGEEVHAARLAVPARFFLTAPLGTHPDIAELAGDRLRTLIGSYDLDPQRTVAVVCGHGTPRNPESRRATVALALRLARQKHCVSCIPAYLDEDLRIEDAPRRLRGYHLVVLPFLIGGAYHATSDIPRRLGLSMKEVDPREAPRGLAAAGLDNRWMICDEAIGRLPGIERIITARAVEGLSERAGSEDSATHPRGVHAGGDDRRVRLGTRRTCLAMWQAEHVAERLRERGGVVEIVALETSGDRDRSRSIAELDGDAPFTDDLDEALRRGDVDLAVHSLKDVPLKPSPEFDFPAILPRGAPGESVVSRDGRRLADLHAGATVGTSSPRRAAQLLSLRPDLVPVVMRGPVDDRVRQVRQGRFDAAILATAGLVRLGLEHEIAESLPLDAFLPAPGQGALVVQVRRADERVTRLVRALDDAPTRAAVAAELAFLATFEKLEGVAAAAWATTAAGLRMRARLIALDGRILWDGVIRGDTPEDVAAGAIRDASRALAHAFSTTVVHA